MADQLTREQLANYLRNGNCRAVVLLVNTQFTISSCSTNYIRPSLEGIGFVKVGGEGNYGGLRGTYLKITGVDEFPANIDFVRHVGILCEEARTTLNLHILAQSANMDNDAVVHVAACEGLLYDHDAIAGLFELPRI